ncbi:enoyl-CoA hydratase/isomerase family protein [Streptomyces sp. NPDC046805]|uniref:enoyl-CoA hydratase/isomerase family protein n=1 Tax=Streptomyces sp. NPDC046805 TaxID=3155134 RepID=UPI0033F3B68A
MAMLDIDLDDGVATITLDSPDRLNALSWELMDRLRDAIESLGHDPAVRVLVVTGRGRAFSAGLDLADLDSQGTGLAREVADGMARSVDPLCTAILESPVPVVAAVNGPCVGGAVGLALLADVTVAARSAYFLVPQMTSLGIVPDMGITWALVRHAGRARAMGMSLLGDRITAEQAHDWGLIWSCVDDDRFAEEMRAIARRLSGLEPTGGVVATRRLFATGHAAPPAAQLADERAYQRDLFLGPGPADRINAFISRGSTSRPR